MGRFSEEFLNPKPEPAPEPGFNPDATDRDGDGLVQDGTKFERPAPVKTGKKKFTMD